MNRISLLALAGAAWGVFWAVPTPTAYAAPVTLAQSPSVGEIIFNEIEKRLIWDYYNRNYTVYQRDYVVVQGGGKGKGNGKGNGKGKGLPPGLAKKGKLPPGIYKQLVRNGGLPPGLESQALPRDLVTQLPQRSGDYRIVIADDRVLLVQAATNVILDILEVPAAPY